MTEQQEESGLAVSRGRASSGWLLILLLPVIAATAYTLYETSRSLSRLEAYIQTLDRRLSSRDSAASTLENLAKMELRLAEIDVSLDLQRRRLQSLELATAAPAAVVQAEPVQAEPEQAEPVQAEPVQAEPVQAEPVQAEPVQAEPVQAEPVQAEPERVALQEPAPNLEQQVTWSVILGSFRERGRANRMVENLASGWLLTEVVEFKRNGPTQYRVAITGLTDFRAARLLAADLEEELSLQGLWVIRSN